MSRQDWCQPGIWERTDISELWKIFCIYRLANGGWIFFLTDPFTRQMEGSFVCIFSLFFPLALLRYNSQITLCKFKVYSRISDMCIHCDSWGREESDMTKQLIWSDLIWYIVKYLPKLPLGWWEPPCQNTSPQTLGSFLIAPLIPKWY